MRKPRKDFLQKMTKIPKTKRRALAREPARRAKKDNDNITALQLRRKGAHSKRL